MPIKLSPTICLPIVLLLISLSKAATAAEASDSEKVWVGKYVTNKISPKMNEQHEINTVCQKLNPSEKHSLDDIANAKVEVKGQLSEEHFVIRYTVPAKDLHLIKHNSRMFCAVAVETEKRGTFLGRPVTFVSGASAVTDGMNIEVLAASEKDEDGNTEKETEVFRCKDKRGNPVFQDSPCGS